MKIAFFGTGDFSSNILAGILLDSRVEVVLAVSQPDKAVGRKKVLQKTPIKILAEENNIEVLQPEKLIKNFEFLDYLDSLELDFILVVAYGKIVPMRVLKAAKYGCINLHGSHLPLYRGASPIQESVKNGDTKTALTIMFMSKGMDEGDILKIQEVDIDKDDKTLDIFNKFEKFGAQLAIDTLGEIKDGKIEGINQGTDKATYCSKIDKKDGEIDFHMLNAQEIYNRFRAYSIWPGIYCFYNDLQLTIEDCSILDDSEYSLLGNTDSFKIGDVIKINKKTTGIVCSDNKILILKQVKLAGKRSMDILSFINGNRKILDYKF